MSKLNKTQLIVEKQDTRLSKSMQIGVQTKTGSQDLQVHVCSESPILFPLFYASSIAWDEQIIFQVAEQQYADYFSHYNNFKDCLKNQSHLLTNAYHYAFKVLDFLEAKLQYRGKSAALEAQLTTDDRARSSNNIKQVIRNVRKEIYVYRKELKEIISICSEPETPLILTVISETGQLRSELTEKYHQLIENVIPGIFFDDITIEMIYQYLVNQKHEGSDEANLYDEVKSLSIAPLIPKFKAMVYELQEIAKSEYNQTQNVLAKLQKLIQTVSNQQAKAVHLYMDIPQLIDQYKINLNQQCSLLPHTIDDDKEYLQLFQLNNELEQKISNDIREAPTKNDEEQLEKNCLQTEITGLVQQQNYFYDIYRFLKAVPDLIEQLRTINIQRTQMWKDLPNTRVIDCQRIKEYQQKCQQIEDQIKQFVAEGKIPFKFQQVQLQAQFESRQLQVLLDYKFPSEPHYTTNPGLVERVTELMKWEYSGELAQGENAEVNKYLIEAFELRDENTQKKPPLIEQEIDQQLEQHNPENFNEIMELNENYAIWKNMQAAGIYLNEDYLSQILNDAEKLPLFAQKMQHLLKFFSVNDQKTYTAYIGDVLTLIKIVQENKIDEAKEFIRASKKIPKIYKEKLISELKKK